MTKSKQNVWIKNILELGPVLIFFLSYRYAPMSDNFEGERSLEQIIFATKVFIPTIFIALLLGWIQTKVWAKMPLFTAIIILIFGGLTIWLRDEMFIKMKPTILYLIFSSILAFGLSRKRSYLKSLMDAALPMKNEGWMILTKRFTMFFVVLAVANEIVWRTFTTDFWISFKTFGLPLLFFVFFFSQAQLISKFKIDDSNES